VPHAGARRNVNKIKYLPDYLVHKPTFIWSKRITADFEATLKAFLRTPPPPKNLGRPKAKKRKTAKKR